jgi:hypothetical protein
MQIRDSSHNVCKSFRKVRASKLFHQVRLRFESGYCVQSCCELQSSKKMATSSDTGSFGIGDSLNGS